MSRIEELYQERLKELAKDPFHFYELKAASHVFTAYNPLCGDKFTFFLKVEGNKIIDCSFSGFGCMISKASSSTLTSKLLYKSLSELPAIVNEFLLSIKENFTPIDDDYIPFVAARKFPERLNCVTLGWEELNNQLKGNKLV